MFVDDRRHRAACRSSAAVPGRGSTVRRRRTWRGVRPCRRAGGEGPGVGRGERGGAPFEAVAVFDGAEIPGRVTGVLQHRPRHPGRGRFAVGAGHADHAQPPRRVGEQGVTQFGVRPAHVRHDALRDSGRRQRSIGEDRRRTVCDCVARQRRRRRGACRESRQRRWSDCIASCARPTSRATTSAQPMKLADGSSRLRLTVIEGRLIRGSMKAASLPRRTASERTAIDRE